MDSWVHKPLILAFGPPNAHFLTLMSAVHQHIYLHSPCTKTQSVKPDEEKGKLEGNKLVFGKPCGSLPALGYVWGRKKKKTMVRVLTWPSYLFIFMSDLFGTGSPGGGVEARVNNTQKPLTDVSSLSSDMCCSRTSMRWSAWPKFLCF